MKAGEILFKLRGFTPIPLILIVLYFAQPTAQSFLWGILLMILGESIRIWGVAYAGGATRTRHVGAPELITSGPFARVRNPLYIGNFIMYTGAALIANVWLPYLVLVVWIYFGLQYYFIVKLEEEKLTQLFGEEYREYKNQVPRFLPSLTAKTHQPHQKPNYSEALRSEKSTFMSFVGILVLFYLKMKFA